MHVKGMLATCPHLVHLHNRLSNFVFYVVIGEALKNIKFSSYLGTYPVFMGRRKKRGNYFFVILGGLNRL